MNEVYATHVGDRPPARSTFQVAALPSGALRRDRGGRAPVGAGTPPAPPRAVPTEIRRYVRSLGLDAYVVGGAVRDELLGIDARGRGLPRAGRRPGRPARGARAARPGRGHGGARPARRRPLLPARPRRSGRSRRPGIELTPPRARAERRPGAPRLRDRRRPDRCRSRTTWRGATSRSTRWPRRLETGELVDPFGGRRATSSGASCARSAPTSFREDPLRILRGLRLALAARVHARPDDTLAQMRAEAAGLRHVSGERIGGGLAADGMGELSKLLLGARPGRGAPARARHRRARRGHPGVRRRDRLRPRLGRASRGRSTSTCSPSSRQTADAGARARACASARCSTTSASPRPTGPAQRITRRSARRIAGAILRRLRYPNALRDEVCRLVAGHAFWLDGPIDGLSRPALPRLARDRARAAARAPQARRPPAKRVEPWELEHLAQLERLARGGAREPAPARPTSRSTATTCSRSGYREGPAIGAALAPPARRSSSTIPPRTTASTLLAEARRWRSLNAAGVRERYLRRPRRGRARPSPSSPRRSTCRSRSSACSSRPGVEVVGENRAQDLAREARRLRRRVPLALHRPPAVEQGAGRRRDLRARPLARLGVDRAPAHGPGAARGQPLRRGDEGGRRRPTRSPAGSSGSRRSAG